MNALDIFAAEAKEFIDSGAYVTASLGVDEESPWSAASLDGCERAFLSRGDDISSQDWKNYQMFLGEGLRREFGGRWATGDEMDPDVPALKELVGIRYPGGDFDVVSTMLDNAIEFGHGRSWSTLFEANRVLGEQG